MQLIKNDQFDDFKKWFEESTQKYPGFDINKIVDPRKGKVKLLKTFIQQEKMTALNYATFYCKFDIVDFLLRNGAGM